MTNPTKYVLGFAYDKFGACAMIQKKRPVFQAGKWNGIGGHVELGDPSLAFAMSREFHEEAGMSIHPSQWRLVGEMQDETKFVIYVFTTQVDLLQVHSCTDESVKVFAEEDLNNFTGPALANIKSLLALTRMGAGHDGVIPYFYLKYGSPA